MLIALAKAVEAVINKGNSITEALILPKPAVKTSIWGSIPIINVSIFSMVCCPTPSTSLKLLIAIAHRARKQAR
jgi:hypothetical protein